MFGTFVIFFAIESAPSGRSRASLAISAFARARLAAYQDIGDKADSLVKERGAATRQQVKLAFCSPCTQKARKKSQNRIAR